MAVSYESLSIPVSGGAIAAGRWGAGSRVVIASHGITANHLSWQRVGELV
ncbi:MAG: alpha/beta hydrolase, partial [Actinomycetia bacterium]|nr:alpha/beta hydrolase [Actinomycetes bacterium]